MELKVRKSKFINKIMSVFLCVIISLSFVQSVAAEMSTGNSRTVRVACFLYDGYFQILEDGSYYGYGFEYLDEIARYAGWEYEYVFGTWSECIERLESGQVDIMPMLIKSEKREDLFEYTENTTNAGEICLFAATDSGYAYEDFEKFDDIRVGMLDNDNGSSLFQQYCDENGFSAESVAYDNMDSILADINEGKIDAFVTGDMVEMEGYMVIGSVGTQQFYMAAPKGAVNIINQADEALEYIKTKIPGFEQGLNDKYFSTGKRYSPIFTNKEKEYIENSPSIKVALYGERNVLSSYDKESRVFSGIAYDFMKLVEKKSGLSFEYLLMPTGVRGYDFFEHGGSDIILPVNVNQFVKTSDSVQKISLDIPTSFVMIGKQDYVFNPNNHFKMALNENGFAGRDAIEKAYPEAEIVYYKNADECFEAVSNGSADVTFENRMVALYKMRSPYYNTDLTIYEAYDVSEEICMILPKDADDLLVSILNKTIWALNDSEVNNIVIDNTVSRTDEYSLAEFLYQYRYSVVIIIIIVSLMICMLVLMLGLRKKNQRYREDKKRLEERREADEKYKAELYYQANFDGKTGLLNRNGFYEKTRQLLDVNTDVKFVILRCDIDRFKAFNDIMGVKEGDRLIQYVADMWKNYFQRHMGTYGYLGGDDYICCCPLSTFDKEDVISIVNKWFDKHRKSYVFSISMGAYVIDNPDVDVHIMCDRAELALSSAKKDKDIHFCFYEENMRKQAVKEQEIINYIPTAFEQEQFEIYLQPQYDSVTRKIVGAEALTRWNHPEQGMISPGTFIPVMEANGMITRLDVYVVEHVCKILKELYENYNVSKELSVAVNLSRIDTFNNSIIGRIEELLDKYDIPIRCMRLEITESAYIEQHEQVSGFVKTLKEKGFIIEMDDFGSGYSSLNALKDVPVDTLKLDLRFLAGDNSKKGGIIINSIIRMAKWLDIPVIAEGVEDAEQVEYLKNIGCHYMQGFYFAKPMPVDRFIELLKENKVEAIDRNQYDGQLEYIREILDSRNINSIILEKICPMAIAEYHNDNVEAVMINDSFYKVLKITRDEYLPYQLHMQDILKEQQKKQFLKAMGELSEKDSDDFKFVFEREGSKIWIKCRLSILSVLENRTTIIMILDDVTNEITGNDKEQYCQK